MKAYRCECGHALTLVVVGVPGTPLTVSDAAVEPLLRAALARHLPRCPQAAQEAIRAS
jgi:hypothetical protein